MVGNVIFRSIAILLMTAPSAAPAELSSYMAGIAPCGAKPSCDPEMGETAAMLHNAWRAEATTDEQRNKMRQIILSYTDTGQTDWETAAQQYFSWRNGAPFKTVSGGGSSSSANAICTQFRTAYDNVSKKLARNQADEAGDNSAARATMREAQNNSALSEARITLDLMKANSCATPSYVPSASRYSLASLKCAAALQRVRAIVAMDRLSSRNSDYLDPPACDTSTWMPSN